MVQFLPLRWEETGIVLAVHGLKNKDPSSFFFSFCFSFLLAFSHISILPLFFSQYFWFV